MQHASEEHSRSTGDHRGHGEARQPPLDLDRPSFHVVLVAPEIPQNTGNISRLCVGACCHLHLVEPLGFELTDRAVRRAGLDHWPELRLRRWNRLEELLEYAGPTPCFFSTKAAPRTVYDVPFTRGAFLIFGCESRGLPGEVLRAHWQQTFRLPVPGPVRSLNLANAVAAVIYEGLRQLRQQGLDLGPARPRELDNLGGHDFHVP
jgi:tRNA (cytidine/uridine-2'-O-)-methyltransferase